jgi:hypothetical protein
MCVDGDEMAI